jgi:hypothetical protein
LLALVLVTPVSAVSSLALSFLLLLGSLAAWAQETEGSREHLAGDTFNDCDDVTCVERLGFI